MLSNFLLRNKAEGSAAGERAYNKYNPRLEADKQINKAPSPLAVYPAPCSGLRTCTCACEALPAGAALPEGSQLRKRSDLLRIQHFLQKLLMGLVLEWGETPKTALLRFSQVGEPAQRKCFTAWPIGVYPA